MTGHGEMEDDDEDVMMDQDELNDHEQDDRRQTEVGELYDMDNQLAEIEYDERMSRHNANKSRVLIAEVEQNSLRYMPGSSVHHMQDTTDVPGSTVHHLQDTTDVPGSSMLHHATGASPHSLSHRNYISPFTDSRIANVNQQHRRTPLSPSIMNKSNRMNQINRSPLLPTHLDVDEYPPPELTPSRQSRMQSFRTQSMRIPGSASNHSIRTPGSTTNRSLRTPGSTTDRSTRASGSVRNQSTRSPRLSSRRSVDPGTTNFVSSPGLTKDQFSEALDLVRIQSIGSPDSAGAKSPRTPHTTTIESTNRHQVTSTHSMRIDSVGSPQSANVPYMASPDVTSIQSTNQTPASASLSESARLAGKRLPARMGTIDAYFKRMSTQAEPRDAASNGLSRLLQQEFHPLRAPLQSLQSKPRKPRQAASQKPRRRQAKTDNLPRFPASVTKSIFSHFSRCFIPRVTLQKLEEIGDVYWKNLVEDVGALAKHAGRVTVHQADVELLMKRQGFLTDQQTLYSLVDTYLPMEYRQEIIPIARAGNVVTPSR